MWKRMEPSGGTQRDAGDLGVSSWLVSCRVKSKRVRWGEARRNETLQGNASRTVSRRSGQPWAASAPMVCWPGRCSVGRGVLALHQTRKDKRSASSDARPSRTCDSLAYCGNLPLSCRWQHRTQHRHSYLDLAYSVSASNTTYSYSRN